MKVRGAVGRCCCDRQSQQPPSVIATLESNWSSSGVGFDWGFGIPCFWGRHWLNSAVEPEKVSGFQTFKLSIPQGATITSATIIQDEIGWTNTNGDAWARQDPASLETPFGSASCDISCEDADTATLITTPAIANGLSRTTASIAGFARTLAQYAQGDYVEITGLAPLVQEVVNRAGWVSGNLIQFLYDEDGNSDFSANWQWGVSSAASSSLENDPVGPRFAPARIKVGWS